MEINLFHALGRGVVDALTSEERKQIDAISTRLSSDPNFKGLDVSLHPFHATMFSKDLVTEKIASMTKERAEAEDYKKQMESCFV